VIDLLKNRENKKELNLQILFEEDQGMIIKNAEEIEKLRE